MNPLPGGDHVLCPYLLPRPHHAEQRLQGATETRRSGRRVPFWWRPERSSSTATFDLPGRDLVVLADHFDGSGGSISLDGLIITPHLTVAAREFTGLRAIARGAGGEPGAEGRARPSRPARAEREPAVQAGWQRRTRRPRRHRRARRAWWCRRHDLGPLRRGQSAGWVRSGNAERAWWPGRQRRTGRARRTGRRRRLRGAGGAART